MSGGSLEYAYIRMEETAERIRHRLSTPVHRAFASHLEKVALALHDLEWMLSDDTGPGDEIPAIMAVISKADVLSEAINAANEAEVALRDAIKEATR